MSQMRTIEVDFDVHQAIELERTGFDESANDALRRLLKMPTNASAPVTLTAVTGSPTQPKNARSWSGKGVELPHGTELRMEYSGQMHRGKIDNGVWIVEGKRSTSPSDAARSAATTKWGTKPNLNGWIYWEVKRPNDAHWRPLKSLRPKARSI